MAYVVWKIFMDKYSKIKLDYRNPITIVNPNKLTSNKKCIEEAWTSDLKIDTKSNASSTTELINCTNEIENKKDSVASTDAAINNGDSESVDEENCTKKLDLNRSEVRRSKSRVRLYLKKCKDRLTGNNNSGNNSGTRNELNNETKNQLSRSKSLTTAWYVDENNKSVDINKDVLNSKLDDLTIELKENNSCLNTDSGITELIDKHLSMLYSNYEKRTRGILIRQARDLLVCTYHGCLKTFEENFLIPFKDIAWKLKEKHKFGELIAWSAGWPLSTETGDLILHLGAINESLVRPHDIYICIKPANNSLVELYAAWRSPQINIQYQKIDYDKEFLTPLSLEMLTDELTQLLQHLIVGVERAIGRLPLNELSFPERHNSISSISSDENFNAIESHLDEKSSQISNSNNNNNNINNNNNNNINAIISNSPKCPLRRSELITKNKMLNNKYILRKFSTKYNDSSGKVNENCGNNGNNVSDDNELKTNSITTDDLPKSESPTMPVFCLGNSFPHIDSDEESPDERNSATTDTPLEVEKITAPRSITELPEKLLTSGIHLPGTRDLNEIPIVTIDANCMIEAGLNCYEVATVLLYYSTIHESSSSYTIILMLEAINDLPVIEIISNSLNLCGGHFKCDEILAICLDKNLLNCRPNCDNKLIKFVTTETILKYATATNIPIKCHGLHSHNQQKWSEFFETLEPFQNQCLATGQRLVMAMDEIRTSDLQGLPTRRQLYAQHRSLSRALMDTDLHYLRKNGGTTVSRLQELAQALNKSNTKRTLIQKGISTNSSNNNNNNNNNNNFSHISLAKTNFLLSNVSKSLSSSSSSSSSSSVTTTNLELTNNHWGYVNRDVTNRLNKVVILFNEVDRAAKRLEKLTEQRRENLRELTRQRALEDEMNEVTSWLQNDGEETLQKFMKLQLDCENVIKDNEQEFEKYYFISMKHLAKGKDLHEAAMELEALKINAEILKKNLQNFGVRLEKTREKIEDAARLHHLINLHLREEDAQQEMNKLAEKIGVPGLLEKCRSRKNLSGFTGDKLKSSIHQVNLISSTPEQLKQSKILFKNSAEENLCHCWRSESIIGATTVGNDNSKNDNEDDEEENSKIADSGLGGCDRCEGNQKLSRVCSCQSFIDEPDCVKSHHSDELEEDCYDRNTKQFLVDIHSPMEANSHLNCHTSNLELPSGEDGLSRLDPKIQKQLLLIIREMIVTERDYVRSLYYVIENYVDELLRDDIPQAMRGQRNVIFGNIEKIFEFHQPHFLTELEQYENSPLKVGAAFLENEQKFYLYALYNKNKPKSDTLMSEYGTQFFKSKQLELNDKMDLASYLLKPVQRMGKYALLLQQLVKVCSNVEGSSYQEIAADVEELQRAEEMVKFQLRHGNDLLAMDSLRDCDVNVKEQGRLLRQNEFLVWQGRGGKKCLRQIFLFEELVLFSKARRFPDHKNLDIYIYKNSIKTSDIGLTAHVGDSTTKFEIWFRKRKPDDTWTLQSMSQDIKNAWTDEVSRLLWKQAKRNREIRLAEMSSMGIGNKPCLDIRPSHNQINDRSITISQLGKAPKLRHSFAGSLPLESVRSSKRPNSLISESSSLSSGTSSSSLSTGSNNGNATVKNSSGLELINETSTLNINSGIIKKHQRSTTLVSQLSVESGILSDISMTPDTESHHEPKWPSILSRKPSSSNSYKSNESTSTSDSNGSNNNRSNNNNNNNNNNNLSNINNNIKTMNKKLQMPTKSEINLAEQDPYVNDSITVHL